MSKGTRKSSVRTKRSLVVLNNQQTNISKIENEILPLEEEKFSNIYSLNTTKKAKSDDSDIRTILKDIVLMQIDIGKNLKTI
ncbi:11845_t:CDS:2, partial [Scutellospora calospora]